MQILKKYNLPENGIYSVLELHKTANDICDFILKNVFEKSRLSGVSENQLYDYILGILNGTIPSFTKSPIKVEAKNNQVIIYSYRSNKEKFEKPSTTKQKQAVIYTLKWVEIPFEGDINSYKDCEDYLNNYYNEAKECETYFFYNEIGICDAADLY